MHQFFFFQRQFKGSVHFPTLTTTDVNHLKSFANFIWVILLMKSNYPYTLSWVCIMQRNKRKIHWIRDGEKLVEIFFRNSTYWPRTFTGPGQRIQREEVHIPTTFQGCQYTRPYLARLNHLPPKPHALCLDDLGIRMLEFFCTYGTASRLMFLESGGREPFFDS